MSDRISNMMGQVSGWRLLPACGVVISIACAQLGASFAARMLPVVGVSGIMALRLGFAALILSLVSRPWRIRRTDINGAGGMLVLYGLSIGVTGLCFYLALRTVPLGVLTALQFCGPLSVALIGSRRILDFLWVGLAATGLALLLPLRSAHSVDPVGAVFALLSGAAWAAYIVMGRRASARLRQPNCMPAFGAIVASLIMVPAGIVGAGAELFHLSVLAAGLVIALLSSALPYLLDAKIMSRVSPRAFGTLASLGPATGALIGFLVLGQRLGLYEWSGIAAIVAASVGTSLSSKPPQVDPA
ncbi:EamA family transporter [Sphingobium sp. AN641]|uniref:EamA family transporter n=1 Tax=Sphingobium sp. AN641 TaxID=3133443 RepID=UPI0030BFEDD2